MRSFFPEYPVAKLLKQRITISESKPRHTGHNQSKYMQGMIALALSRTGDTKTPADILRSLKETSIVNEESGMYWKNEIGG